MLIAHWPLEGNAKDEAYGNYNGTEIGGVSYGDGILGDCYDNTSGSGTGIQLMEHADARKFDNVFSWSLWFKSTTTSGGTYQRVISRDCSEYMCMAIDQSQSGSQSINGTGGSAQVNEWHHWAYVHESDTSYRTYLDGQQISSGSEAKSGASKPWVIGGNTERDGDISGNHFEGKIDDVRFYDHVLSVAEIKELSQGKVGHWDFFDGNAYDSTVQGNDGTLQGNPQRADGIIGSDSLNLDGSGDYVSVSYDHNDAEQITLSGWVNQNSQSTWARLVDFGTNSSNYIFIAPYNSGADPIAELQVNGNSKVRAADGSTTLGTGNWYHMACTYDGSTLILYIDGQQVATESGSYDLRNINFSNSYIGRSQYSDPDLDAKVDDVRVYSTALSQSEIQTIYETKARLDDGHRFHGHSLEEGAYEDFETGSFGENWNVSNATISSNRQYEGTYSFGSWGDGGLEATWEVFPNGERKIKSFEYFWKEDTSQSGHVVALNDSNGNVIQESGTENPQWYLNNGSGGREFISSSGTNYNVWTRFRFEFDWENGNYDYLLEKTNGSHRETGTQPLESASNGVQYIRFSGGSSLNNYGSANYNRFDNIKINEEGVREEGFIDSSKLSEVGPAADSLVGWWDFDRENGRNKAGGDDGTISGGVSFNKGVNNGKSIDMDGNDDRVKVDNVPTNGTSEVTVAAWVYITGNAGNSWERHVDLQNGSGGQIVVLRWDDDGAQYGFQALGANADVNEDPPQNVWLHWVGVVRNGTAYFYENATQRATGSTGGGSTASSSVLGIGNRYDKNDHALARIDDVRVYNRALSDEEVDVLYEMSGPDAKMKKRPEGFYSPEFSETDL